MTQKTFDPKKINVIVGGSRIVGLDGDTMISIERDVPELFTDHSAAYGTVTRYKTSNNLVTITLTLSQASDGNDILSSYVQLDKTSDSGSFSVTIQDLNGKSVFFSSNAWVLRQPVVEYGNENKSREWVLKAVDMDMFIGGIR